MAAMSENEIMDYLKVNIDPLENVNFGSGYRASAFLKDGTYLPCVTFRNPKAIIDLAMKRFQEEQSGKSIFSKASGLGYREIVKSFVARGNCVNPYDIT